MRRTGLHLNALRAFEAAARLSSFSRAAEELHVSHSTISHHVKGLETAIGVELFQRRNRGVALTGAGETLLPVLTQSFDQIFSTLAELKPAHIRRPLNVTVTQSFASRWLVPHLWRFREAHREIEVKLQSSLSLADFRRGSFDLGVRCGAGEWPGVSSEMLLPIHMTPLCSPALLVGRQDILKPRDLGDLTLIHADVSEVAGADSEWREWLVAAGAADVDCSHGLSFHDPGLALQAAVDGLGVAMGYLELAETDLANGRLLQPFQRVVRHPWSYYIVVPAAREPNPQVDIFCAWLRIEAERNQ